MAKAVIMPKFGMDQEEGTVVRWLKAEGETVAKGEPLLEVETDKVNMEVEAPASGTLAAISAVPGTVVPIGKSIALILAAGEQAAVSPAAAPAAAAEALPPGGDARPRVTPVAANVARSHGVSLEAVAPAAPGQRIQRRDVESYLSAQQETAAAEQAAPGKPIAVPAARRQARTLGLDLATIAGTGPGGRIQSRDVAAAVEARPAPVPSAEQPAATPPPPGGKALRRLVPLTSTRRTIVRRLVASVQQAPQFTITMQAHMGRALETVSLLAAAQPQGPRFTLTALLVRVCAVALGEHPAVNASYQEEGIAEWADANIGVAVAADEGLVVPVIHQAQALSLARIATQLEELAGKARAGTLAPADVQDGTFTISNLGMLGVDSFTAIVNPPQAAILAVGRVVRQAWVAEDGSVEVAPLMQMTLTADHRVLDGALAARFLASVKRYLEQPLLLL